MIRRAGISLLAASLCACPGSWALPITADSLKNSADTVRTPASLLEPKVISETPIPPPTAKFRMDSGAVFSFATIDETLAGDTSGNSRAVRLAAGLGAFPANQRIAYLGPGRLRDTAIIVLSALVKSNNPRAVAKARHEVLYLLTSSSAQIDSANGAIKREIRQLIGDSVTVDTLEGKYRDFTRTLWDFYAPWMLHLSDTFRYARTVSNPLAGITSTSLETIGRDTVEGRACWVVRFQSGAPDRQGLIKTYWVDLEERVAMQVRQGHLVMRRVRKAPLSPNEKK